MDPNGIASILQTSVPWEAVSYPRPEAVLSESEVPEAPEAKASEAAKAKPRRRGFAQLGYSVESGVHVCAMCSLFEPLN